LDARARHAWLHVAWLHVAWLHVAWLHVAWLWRCVRSAHAEQTYGGRETRTGHTHTHTQRERERDRHRERGICDGAVPTCGGWGCWVLWV